MHGLPNLKILYGSYIHLVDTGISYIPADYSVSNAENWYLQQHLYLK